MELTEIIASALALLSIAMIALSIFFVKKKSKELLFATGAVASLTAIAGSYRAAFESDPLALLFTLFWFLISLVFFRVSSSY
jgi:hypothetical protein